MKGQGKRGSCSVVGAGARARQRQASGRQTRTLPAPPQPDHRTPGLALLHTTRKCTLCASTSSRHRSKRSTAGTERGAAGSGPCSKMGVKLLSQHPSPWGLHSERHACARGKAGQSSPGRDSAGRTRDCARRAFHLLALARRLVQLLAAHLQAAGEPGGLRRSTKRAQEAGGGGWRSELALLRAPSPHRPVRAPPPASP